jgi:hypothetical protein
VPGDAIGFCLELLSETQPGVDPYKRLKTALKADIDEDAWASMYATESRPFPAPDTGKIAVKVINDYGDEVMQVFEVSEQLLGKGIRTGCEQRRNATRGVGISLTYPPPDRTRATGANGSADAWTNPTGYGPTDGPTEIPAQPGYFRTVLRRY